MEKIYLADPYCKETEATVTSSEANVLEFDRTIFYPTGGGQPCDLGQISINEKLYSGTDVKKEGDRVLHILNEAPSTAPGAKAFLKLDWNRRYAHMRYHTTLHVMDGILESRRAFDNSAGGSITCAQLYHDRARIDFDVPNCTREMVQLLIDVSQKFIDEGHEVKAKMLTREEADRIPNLARTEPGRELLKKLTEIRVIEIEGLDSQLDGGTHVANTREIGNVTLSNYENKGSRKKRIEIVLG